MRSRSLQVRGGSTDQIFSFHIQRACSVHFPDQNNTSCLTLLSVSATGVKLQQPLPKPEHRRREFTCLQVCHHHCHLCFCPAVASSCHLPRTEQGTAHTLSWHVDLCRELPICCLSTFPQQIPVPRGGDWEWTRDTTGEHPRHCPAAGSSSMEPTIPAPQPQTLPVPSQPSGMMPLLLRSAVATVRFWILPQVHPRTAIPISQSDRAPETRNPVSSQMMGFILL